MLWLGLPFQDGLEVFHFLLFRQADHVVGEVTREANVGGDAAEGDILLGFPGDAQVVRYGINICHAVCELHVFLGSVSGVRAQLKWCRQAQLTCLMSVRDLW